MNADVERMLILVHRVQAAWDHYNVQVRLPEDGAWRTQGHVWDPYNRARLVTQARRDPVAMSAAWNDGEAALLELSMLAGRLRGGASLPAVELPGSVWHDHRMGPYSPAPTALPPAETIAVDQPAAAA